jgi:hypothetical protein
MGYDTNFSIHLYAKSEENVLDRKTCNKVFSYIEKQSGYKLDEKNPENGFAGLYEAHWYDCARDLAEVSKRHPGVIIEVDGEGEDRDDTWCARFLDGELERVEQETRFPPFKTILRPEEKKPVGADITLEEIMAYNRERTQFESRCREQFTKNVREHIHAHPDLPDGRIHFDPDSTFTALRETKHFDSYTGDVLSVGLDKKDRLIFRHSSQYDVENNLNLSDEAGYGLFIEDWSWALQILLLHLEEPYVPEEYQQCDETDTAATES